ncbi:MAG: hypothetical protein HYZ75_16190 [Elusimicrobia bacterium]|nr:hypothetical protein [Elusimicrobiota bacterium]
MATNKTSIPPGRCWLSSGQRGKIAKGAGRLFSLLALLLALDASNARASALNQAATVSPYEALRQGSGVELRDAFNRPISRAELSRELRAGARAEAALAATPAAKAWSEFVERAESLARALRGERSESREHEVFSLAPVRPNKQHRFSVRAGQPSQAPRPSRRELGRVPPPAPDRSLVLPLRC